MKKIIIEVEIDQMDSFDCDYTDELADKIQKNLIKTAHKTVKMWNFWNTIKNKLVSLTTKVE
jgi:hypothetical protein